MDITRKPGRAVFIDVDLEAAPLAMAFLFRGCVRNPHHTTKVSSSLHNKVLLRLISIPAQAYLQPVKSGILAVTLDRPKAKNAISTQLLREFRDCITTAAKNKLCVDHP